MTRNPLSSVCTKGAGITAGRGAPNYYTLTLLGYTMGLARDYVSSPSPLLPTFLVAAGTAAGVAFHEVTTFLVGQTNPGFGQDLKVAIFAGIYGGVLTPVFYPLLRRALEQSRHGRVVRARR